MLLLFLSVFVGQEFHKRLFPFNMKPEPEVSEAVSLV